MDTRLSKFAPRPRVSKAFTLIELLVVIAIIAILAAILFPIAGTVREQARQSSTLSNLHAIYVASKTYAEDEGRFPASLFGYAETRIPGAVAPMPLVAPALPGDGIVPIDEATETFSTAPTAGSGFKTYQRGFLYREQLKDYRTFLCDDNPIKDKIDVTVAYWPLNSPISIRLGGTLASPIMVTWTQTDLSTTPKTYGDTDLPSAFYAGKPKLFYKMDSMDIGPMLDSVGNVVKDAGVIRYELHYSPDWTHRLGVGNSSDPTLDDVYPAGYPSDLVGTPVTRQLKYKFPPSEKTFITWVTDHAAVAKAPTSIVLLLSGTARKVDNKFMFKYAPINY